MSASSIAVDATVTVRDVVLDVEVEGGHTVGVVGPNGAGKSTLLGLVSGELRPDAGTVRIGGQEVAGPRRVVPPHRRSVGVLAQRPLLFGHLRVVDNVAFGVRARGVAKAVAHQRAMTELEAVGLADLAGRWPAALSVGQAQRVALARALATDPAVLLLDEPLAALDVAAASSMRVLLAERLAGRTVLMVTHDPLDLWTLASSMVVLEGGRVLDHGSTESVLARPASRFVADLAGLNRLAGVAVESGSAVEDDHAVHLADGVEVTGVPDEVAGPVVGQEALALFEPAAVSVHLSAPGGSPRNTFGAEVTGLEPRGALVRVHAVLAGGQRASADVTPRSIGALGLTVGTAVVLAVKAAQVRIVRH